LVTNLNNIRGTYLFIQNIFLKIEFFFNGLDFLKIAGKCKHEDLFTQRFTKFTQKCGTECLCKAGIRFQIVRTNYGRRDASLLTSKNN